MLHDSAGFLDCFLCGKSAITLTGENTTNLNILHLLFIGLCSI